VASPARRPPAPASWKSAFSYQGRHEAGFCNVCGTETLFTFSTPSFFRESLVCACCGSTSRYRSIARGILRAIRDRRGVEIRSLSALSGAPRAPVFRVYDTQVPFEADSCAYPIPALLSKCAWIEVETSTLRPDEPLGKSVAPGVTNQSLEALTFPDGSFDLVVTSDVMEHVRLDDKAHREIHRVLVAGGVYVFTAPDPLSCRETVIRRRVVVPEDPSRDEDVLPPQYHGDANSPDGKALAYRAYGTDLPEKLRPFGFSAVYSGDDVPEHAIRKTELFYCTKQPAGGG
jgi:SAM-dependent methyltransferase